MTKIFKVESGSLAEEAGICPGDYFVALNDKEINDILEFKFLTADKFFTITVKKPDESYEVIEVYNDYCEDFGIEFENALISKAKSCANKCIFCFIDQLPKNMRETLYFKDDDSRLSFLQGNYITMTNLSDKEIDSIINMKMSPINVSVHCTDPELRVYMTGNKRASKLLSQMKKFSDAGIIMNCQIVLCPGINDGKVLDKTLEDLSEFVPNVFSVSVVPVGMTKFRDGLCKLEPFNKQRATELLQQVDLWQNKFLKKFGKRIVYAADEFYILAKKSFPAYENYEDFPQLENGVGMVAVTNDEFNSELELVKNVNIKTVTVVTGKISEAIIKKLTDKIDGINCSVIGIENNFFGKSITVSGLVTATDIIEQLKDKELGDFITIPVNMLRADTDVFLDDLTIKDVEEQLNIKVKVVNDGAELVRILTE